MAPHALDPEDMDTLAAILEREMASHCRKRTLCLFLFSVSFVLLLMAFAVIALTLMRDLSGASGEGGMTWWVLSYPAALGAVVMSSFSAWWGVQNCVNSIERTLFAARARRTQLMAAFLQQLQCADKEKKRAWLEILKDAMG